MAMIADQIPSSSKEFSTQGISGTVNVSSSRGFSFQASNKAAVATCTAVQLSRAGTGQSSSMQHKWVINYRPEVPDSSLLEKDNPLVS